MKLLVLTARLLHLGPKAENEPVDGMSITTIKVPAQTQIEHVMPAANACAQQVRRKALILPPQQ